MRVASLLFSVSKSYCTSLQCIMLIFYFFYRNNCWLSDWWAFLISIVICCIVFACRRRQASHGRVIATNTSTGLPQLNPPHPCQVPPAFQQTYTCYPPPQLEQQQTLTPPQPYNPEATEVSEPPTPSYIEVTQGRSGGVYTPSDPLPSPSAPPPVD